VTKDKDFINGAKTADQILADFLNSFDGAKGKEDGVVSKSEWIDYYTDVANSVPSDEYFVAMMESTWCISEDEQSSVFGDKVK
jgi:hypothetical protein